MMYELPKTSKAIFRDDKGFERSKKIMAALGSPQNAHKTIHVAGTSGKGSICYLVDSILRAQGKKTGMMISPHVYDIRERIQINGQMVDKEKFTKFAELMLAKLEDFHPSYFEALTSLGFLITSKEDLDYMIVETGFGGLWDTTNAINSADKLSVINKIGYDHTAILGSTIEEIATQKAGIIQENGQAIIVSQQTEALKVLTSYAKLQKADFLIVEELNNYQSTNIMMAKSVVKKLANRDGWTFDEKKADKIIPTTFIPGRYEKIIKDNHLIILDGAHNPQKLESLTARLNSEGITPTTTIFAIGQRKDWKSCIEKLKGHTKRVIATEFFTSQSDVPHKALPVGEITSYCESIGLESYAKPSPQEAVDCALSFPEKIVVTGSFYILGEIKPFIN